MGSEGSFGKTAGRTEVVTSICQAEDVYGESSRQMEQSEERYESVWCVGETAES